MYEEKSKGKSQKGEEEELRTEFRTRNPKLLPRCGLCEGYRLPGLYVGMFMREQANQRAQRGGDPYPRGQETKRDEHNTKPKVGTKSSARHFSTGQMSMRGGMSERHFATDHEEMERAARSQ